MGILGLKTTAHLGHGAERRVKCCNLAVRVSVTKRLNPLNP